MIILEEEDERNPKLLLVLLQNDYLLRISRILLVDSLDMNIQPTNAFMDQRCHGWLLQAILYLCSRNIDI